MRGRGIDGGDAESRISLPFGARACLLRDARRGLRSAAAALVGDPESAKSDRQAVLLSQALVEC